jgi:hypothetical protein
MAKHSLEEEVVEEAERLAHMPIVYLAIGRAFVAVRYLWNIVGCSGWQVEGVDGDQNGLVWCIIS